MSTAGLIALFWLWYIYGMPHLFASTDLGILPWPKQISVLNWFNSVFSYVRQMFAEFLGTFALVLIGDGAVAQVVYFLFNLLALIHRLNWCKSVFLVQFS